MAAHDLGVDPMTLKAWEEGFKAPRYDKAESLATYLEISRAEVLGLLGILRPDEVEQLRMRPRNPTPARARKKAAPAAAQASATLSEDQGAYLSGPISVPVLALVA